MSTKDIPNHYQSLKERFPKVAAAISWADDVIQK